MTAVTFLGIGGGFYLGFERIEAMSRIAMPLVFSRFVVIVRSVTLLAQGGNPFYLVPDLSNHGPTVLPPWDRFSSACLWRTFFLLRATFARTRTFRDRGPDGFRRYERRFWRGSRLPAVFAAGVEPTSGPRLITLPESLARCRGSLRGGLFFRRSSSPPSSPPSRWKSSTGRQYFGRRRGRARLLVSDLCCRYLPCRAELPHVE
jgi:hypothetical protein